MKKLSLILAIVMLFSVFAAACTPPDETSDGTDDSDDVTSDTSGDSLMGTAVREGAYQTVISTGAAYTKSTEADDKYPDTYKTELTDGILLADESDNYFDECLNGYAIIGKELNIDVDLGNVYDNIYMFKVGYLATRSAGIDQPSYAKVQYSLDGSEWSNYSTMLRDPFVEGTRKEATAKLKEYVSARYVRFTVAAASYWIFLDEVQVIADVEGENINEAFAQVVQKVYDDIGAPLAPATNVAIDRSLYPVLVSRFAKYKIDGKINSSFPDKAGGDGVYPLLTDGQTSGVYEGETWVGFEGNQEVTITVDLGETINDIATLELKSYTNTGIGNFLPAAVKFAALDKDGNRTELGNVFASSAKSLGAYSFVLPLREAITARSIEFTLVNTDTKLMLVEECAVYAYRDQEDTVLYPDVVLDKTDNGNWPDASTKSVNLLYGLGQQISAIHDPGRYGDYFNTPISTKVLTDGRTSPGAEIHNGYYCKFYGGNGRNVYYDLGHLSSLESFTASFVNREEWAVHSPTAVIVLVSADAEKWYEAGTIVMTGSAVSNYKGTLKLNKKVKARYIAFSFAIKGWGGCDELQAFGTTSLSGAVDLDKSGLPNYNIYNGERMAPSQDVLNGATDLVLLYNGPKNGYTVDDLLPYVAYVDTEGNIKDTMFDSFLFLPGSLPSGNKSYADSTKVDFEWNINDIFAEGKNMFALEEAAGKVKEALGLSDDFKYKVTMTICYPSWERKDFGDIDGDGVGEDLTVYENRVKVVKWYIDECEKRFNESNFKNLELVGYYWMNEDITATDPNAYELSNDISKLCHDVGKSYFWIPYFTAYGYELWEQYGFDVACMQPNYVFKATTPISNLISCAKLTALYHMGVELEICNESLFDELFFDKYMAYMSYGTTYGYMTDAMHMYYQGTYIFRDAAKSSTYMGRKVYDTTYHFIKHDLKTVPEPVAVSTYTAEKNKAFHGTIDFPNENMRLLRTVLNATHGSVTMNDDGSFDYYPEKDYTGEVKFSFTYSEHLDWSEPIEVTINVQ